MDVIGQQHNGDWGYFDYDVLGSVRQMTDLSGVLNYAASYDPYGASTTNLGFTGEFSDPSGLLYLRARYMNSVLGMFASKDPVEGVTQQQLFTLT